jgi:hypothetical protein
MRIASPTYKKINRCISRRAVLHFKQHHNRFLQSLARSMGEKTYNIRLDDSSNMYTYLRTVRGRVKAFVVKLICKFGEHESEVVRFDSGHGVPHVDFLNAKGEVVEKKWLQFLENEQAVSHAQTEIRRDYIYYRERFSQWQSKEHRKSRRRKDRGVGR